MENLFDDNNGIVLVKNYLYKFHVVRSEGIIWHCYTDKCPAKMVTTTEGEIMKVDYHPHGGFFDNASVFETKYNEQALADVSMDIDFNTDDGFFDAVMKKAISELPLLEIDELDFEVMELGPTATTNSPTGQQIQEPPAKKRKTGRHEEELRVELLDYLFKKRVAAEGPIRVLQYLAREEENAANNNVY